jgi:DNA-directed RNA polymerase subunit M/transcription elongation factor TFIIS
MKCPDCQGELAVLRQCRRVRLKCGECGREYQIHELAAGLDEKTEEILARYTAIIYD